MSSNLIEIIRRPVVKSLEQARPGELVQVAVGEQTFFGFASPRSDDHIMHSTMPVVFFQPIDTQSMVNMEFYPDYERALCFGGGIVLEPLAFVKAYANSIRPGDILAYNEHFLLTQSILNRGGQRTGTVYFNFESADYKRPTVDEAFVVTKWRLWWPGDRDCANAQPIFEFSRTT